MNTTCRKPNTLKKLERMNKALRHEEPDRVPISDFFWGSFVERWRRELGLPRRRQPLLPLRPRLDRHGPEHGPLDPPVRDAQGDAPRRSWSRPASARSCASVSRFPMPEMRAWEIDTFEKLERAEFDDPRDRRRFFEAGDNQIAGVGDGFQRNTPAWIDTVKALRPDFPVYGSMIEVSECLTRLIGQENAMLWMGLYPERMGEVIHRIGEFYLECAKAAIDAGRRAARRLRHLGRRGLQEMACSSRPPTGATTSSRGWRRSSTAPTPTASRSSTTAAATCRRSSRTSSRSASTPTTRWRPRPAWTCVDLRRRYGHRIAFCGNSDIRVWETRRPRGHPPRSPPQAQRRPGRRLHLPVRPLRHQRRRGQTYDYHRRARARMPAATRCNSASSRSRSEPACPPFFVAASQTFGERINFHPHLHFLVTEGGMDRPEVFHRISSWDDARLAEMKWNRSSAPTAAAG